jgi:uracil-DNA glycosylase
MACSCANPTTRWLPARRPAKTLRVEPLQHALLMHLQAAADAYGSELLLPKGTAQPRAPVEPAAPAPAATAPAEPSHASAAVRAETAVRPSTAAAAIPVTAAAPTAHPAPAGDDTAAQLATLRAEVLPCRRCKLCEGRRNVVFGEGSAAAEVMFVGEAPGSVEDQTGRPFVGPAGQLLDRIIQGAMGLQRGDVYIANINKCRPPGNRDPEPDEVAACLPYLLQQVRILRPRVIVALGRIAAHNLLATQAPMRAMRGRDHAFDGIPVVVTWHPAFLLRDPSHNRETGEDIKRVNRLLGRPEVPGSGT